MSRLIEFPKSRLSMLVLPVAVVALALLVPSPGVRADECEIGGAGWWQGFGAVKNLRAVKGLSANDVLDALQELDTYVARLGTIPENQTSLVRAIRETRALVARALGKILEASADEALADAGDPAADKLRTEAASLREDAGRLIPEIRKHTAAAKVHGEAWRKAAKA